MPHDHEQRQPPSPPQPPRFTAKIRLTWLQIVGTGLLSLLPIAAVLGAFGLRMAESEAASGGLVLHVSYPDRMRHATSGLLELNLRNTGSQALHNVTVRIADAYLSHFGEAEATPAPERLSGDGAEFELAELPPGQVRRVVVRLRADERGRHQGRIRAVATGGPQVEVTVGTRVLP